MEIEKIFMYFYFSFLQLLPKILLLKGERGFLRITLYIVVIYRMYPVYWNEGEDGGRHLLDLQIYDLNQISLIS